MHLLDTDICIQFMKGENKAVGAVMSFDDIYISAATLAELFYGIYNSKNIGRHRKTLAMFLTGVSVLNTDIGVVNNFGAIKAKLRDKGGIVGDFDILNASFAITYGMVLVTRNLRHYQNIEGLEVRSA